MGSMNKEVKRLRQQVRRMLHRGGGVLRWEQEEWIRAIGEWAERNEEITRSEAARQLGMKPFQLDYLISRYRVLPRQRPKQAERKKIKLAPVEIVEDAPKGAEESQGQVELVLESGIRVAVQSASQLVEVLDQLEGRSRKRRLAA